MTFRTRLIPALLTFVFPAFSNIPAAAGNERRQSIASTVVEDAGSSRRPAPDSYSAQSAAEPSLARAFEEARRRVWPLTEAEAKLQGNEGVRFFGSVPRQNFTVRFSDGTVALAAEGWRATLGLAAVNGKLCHVKAPPSADRCRVDYEHADGIREWFENGADGVKHGFVLPGRPPRESSAGELELRFTLTGLTVRSRAESEQDALDWINPETGAPVLRYRGLVVNDADGAVVPARMSPVEGGFVLIVDDARAAYPLTIDPLITGAEQKLWPSFNGDGASEDYFGNSVALDGDTIVVGAEGDDSVAGFNAGSAYVFVQKGNGWVLQAKLLPELQTDYAGFGAAVGLQGDTAVIGAPTGDSTSVRESGNVCVFVRSGGVWRQQARLVATGAARDDRFGTAVAIRDDVLAVGAATDDTPAGEDAGSISIFVRDGAQWSAGQQIFDPEGGERENFGTAVALGTDVLIAGAPGDNLPGFYEAGSALVFARNGPLWESQFRLRATEPVAGESIGSALAVSDGRIVVGARGRISFHSRTYLFKATNGVWQQESVLSPQNVPSSGAYGQAVAIEGDTVLIGHPVGDVADEWRTGTVEVFVRGANGWERQAVLANGPSLPAGDGFGSALAFQGDTVVVGSPYRNTEAGDNAGSAHIFTRVAGVWTMQQTLTSGDGGQHEYFGMSVALKGDRALIGAGWDHTVAAYYGGSAYLFIRSGDEWSLETRLAASDAKRLDKFGSAVAMTPDTLVIGAPEAEPLGTGSISGNTGTVYIFSRNGATWMQTAKLFGSINAHGGHFGSGVAISGDTVLAGAPYDQSSSHGSGEAYVFLRTGQQWSQQARLPTDAPDGSLGYAGYAVALEGDTAVVGSSNESYNGVVRVYVRNGTVWSRQAKLTASDGDVFDVFGGSVAISGDTVLIGAPSHDDKDEGVNGVGSAYLFTRVDTTWTETAKMMLNAGIRGAYDAFGTTVVLSGDRALISAVREGVPGATGKGEAFLYQKTETGWIHQASFAPFDNINYKGFGSSLALDGDTVLVGAYGDDTPDPVTGDPRLDHGSVYAFRLIDPNWALAAYYQWLPADGPALPPTAIPYGDGVPNLLKYAFNMNAAGPDRRELVPATGTAGLPSVRLVSTSDGPRIRIEFLRRTAAGLTYTPMKTLNVAAGPWQALDSAPMVTTLENAWERVVHIEPIDPFSPRLFYRVRVTFDP